MKLRVFIISLFVLIASAISIYPFVRKYLIPLKVTTFYNSIDQDSEYILIDSSSIELSFKATFNYNLSESKVKKFVFIDDNNNKYDSTSFTKMKSNFFSSIYSIQKDNDKYSPTVYSIYGYYDYDGKFHKIKNYNSKKILVSVKEYIKLTNVFINNKSNTFSSNNEYLRITLHFFNPYDINIDSIEYLIDDVKYETSDIIQEKSEINFTNVSFTIKNEFTKDFSFVLNNIKFKSDNSNNIQIVNFEPQFYYGKKQNNYVIKSIVCNNTQELEKEKISFSISMIEKEENSINYIETTVNNENIKIKPSNSSKEGNNLTTYNFEISSEMLAKINLVKLNSIYYNSNNVVVAINKEFDVALKNIVESNIALKSKKQTTTDDKNAFYLQSLIEIPNFVIEKIIIEDITKSKEIIVNKEDITYNNKTFIFPLVFEEENDQFYRSIKIKEIHYTYNNKFYSYTYSKPEVVECSFIKPTIKNVNFYESNHLMWFDDSSNKNHLFYIELEKNINLNFKELYLALNSERKKVIPSFIRSDGNKFLYAFEIDCLDEVNDIILENAIFSISGKEYSFLLNNKTTIIHYISDFDYIVSINDKESIIDDNSRFYKEDVIKYSFYTGESKLDKKIYFNEDNSIIIDAKRDYIFASVTEEFTYNGQTYSIQIPLEVKILGNQVLTDEEIINSLDLSHITNNENTLFENTNRTIYLKIPNIELLRIKTSSRNGTNEFTLSKISDSAYFISLTDSSNYTITTIVFKLNDKIHTVSCKKFFSFNYCKKLIIKKINDIYYEKGESLYPDNYACYKFEVNNSSFVDQIEYIEFENGEKRSLLSKYDNYSSQVSFEIVSKTEIRLIIKHNMESKFKERGNPIKYKLKDDNKIYDI